MATWKELIDFLWGELQPPPALPAPYHRWQAQLLPDRTIYSGEFKLYGQNGRLLVAIPGRIVEWRAFPADVYLFDPPLALRRTPKGACLQLVSPRGSWFKLHWQRPARTFDECRIYVEGLLLQLLPGK